MKTSQQKGCNLLNPLHLQKCKKVLLNYNKYKSKSLTYMILQSLIN